MYINTKPSAKSEDGPSYEWATFSALPANASITPGNAVHLFPYKGDFYLSVGRAVWKKAHVGQRDEGCDGPVGRHGRRIGE